METACNETQRCQSGFWYVTAIWLLKEKLTFFAFRKFHMQGAKL